MHQIIQKQLVAVGGRHFSKGSTCFFSGGGHHFIGCTYYLGCVGHHFHYGYLSCGRRRRFYLSERVKNMLVFALLV